MTLQHFLVHLRDESGIPEHISALRVLDVVAWMEWKHRLPASESTSVESTDPEPVTVP